MYTNFWVDGTQHPDTSQALSHALSFGFDCFSIQAGLPVDRTVMYLSSYRHMDTSEMQTLSCLNVICLDIVCLILSTCRAAAVDRS